jgi:hypothetical protein
MFDESRVPMELEEQRCLIEQQQVEIQRQRHQIRLLRELTVAMQGELDALRAVLHTSPPSMSRRPSNGHDLAERRQGSETSDRT